MSRFVSAAAPLTVVLTTLMLPTAWAQEYYSGRPGYGGEGRPVSQERQFVPPTPMSAVAGPAPVYTAVPSQPGYVQLGAPLYPSPRPNIPIETGATFITNQALAPHEMLYPHTYRSMYGPYYHRVTGTYFWTPMGMRTHEKWELQGTMVTVKYRSQQPFFKRLAAPTISTNGGPWE